MLVEATGESPGTGVRVPAPPFKKRTAKDETRKRAPIDGVLFGESLEPAL